MNSRDYKIFRDGNFYHIFNRGNNKQTIFFENQDYFVFLSRIKLALGFSKVLFEEGKKNQVRIHPFPKNTFSIICYCLMPNHFHFLVRQNADTGIDRLISKVCTSYAKYFNLKYGHIGNVFQDRFKSKIVETDSYLTYLSAYIHNNPSNPLEYDFSSFKDYLGVRQGQICEKSFLLSLFNNDQRQYKKFVLGFSEKDKEKIKDLLFED